MKRLLLPVLAALLVTSGSTAFAADPPPAAAAATPGASGCLPASPTADQAVACVQKVYDASQTFTSDFSQKFWVKAYNQEKSSHGHVTFAKPGKMHWTYDDPQSSGNRVVSDGSVIKVYEASNKQMYEQPVDKSQYPAALSFLTGTGKLSDSFTFEVKTGEEMKFPGGLVLLGTPKAATPAYSKVLFYVDSGTSQVRRVMIIDGQGNRNRFDFDAPKVNVPTPADMFQFTPPPGTSIIHP
ncbi:MAG TPA: outer membrane lipoprotein carrier protein LolA [Polyangiaceae bacterium]|jgi:outer membrane lipoprotein carrier protein